MCPYASIFLNDAGPISMDFALTPVNQFGDLRRKDTERVAMIS